jgi:hypothetical protein
VSVPSRLVDRLHLTGERDDLFRREFMGQTKATGCPRCGASVRFEFGAKPRCAACGFAPL